MSLTLAEKKEQKKKNVFLFCENRLAGLARLERWTTLKRPFPYKSFLYTVSFTPHETSVEYKFNNSSKKT